MPAFLIQKCYPWDLNALARAPDHSSWNFTFAVELGYQLFFSYSCQQYFPIYGQSLYHIHWSITYVNGDCDCFLSVWAYYAMFTFLWGISPVSFSSAVLQRNVYLLLLRSPSTAGLIVGQALSEIYVPQCLIVFFHIPKFRQSNLLWNSFLCYLHTSSALK